MPKKKGGPIIIKKRIPKAFEVTKNIWEAAATNDVPSINILLEKGISVDSQTKNGETPLHFATLNGAFDAAFALISARASVHIKTKHFLETPLHFAVEQGSETLVKLLLDAGSDPNAKDSSEESPIFTCIRWCQPKIIPILVNHGARINDLNNQHRSPLHLAVSFQSPVLVKALIEAGETTEVSGVPLKIIQSLAYPKELTLPMDTDLKTPITSRPRNTESILFDLISVNSAGDLSRALSRENSKDFTNSFNKESLLHYASSIGASECVLELLKAGANVNIQTEYDRESALHIAVREGYFDIFHFLLQYGANIDIENVEGETPLFLAVKQERIEFLRCLTRRKSNVNHLNHEQLSPIDFAVMTNNLFVIDSLLYYEANPTLGSINPYMYAFKLKNLDTAAKIKAAKPELAVETSLPQLIFDIIKSDDADKLLSLIKKRI